MAEERVLFSGYVDLLNLQILDFLDLLGPDFNRLGVGYYRVAYLRKPEGLV